ncbi:MAG: tyrosine-type recombinase/integrase [Microvirga sp.]
MRYRPKGIAGAPKRFITIGRHGPVTAEQARTRALSILGLVASGHDPAGPERAGKDTLILAEAVELFMQEHVRLKRKPRTAEYYQQLFTAYVTPSFGRQKVDSVTRNQLARLHADMAGRPFQANRMLSAVSSLYGFLGRRSMVAEGFNPARGIELYRELGRERYLTSAELSRLGAALHEAETVGLPRSVRLDGPHVKHLARPENRRTLFDANAVAAIRLLALTGARLREILTLRWEEVDLERGLAFLGDSKTGRKTLVFSSAAIQILKGLPRTGVYVVAGATANAPRADLKKPWEAIKRRAELGDLRLHDLRHTFASIGAGASLGLPIVGKLLGHKQPQTTARYAHLDASPLRRAVDLIGEQLVALTRDAAHAASIAPLPPCPIEKRDRAKMNTNALSRRALPALERLSSYNRG